jgi:hypothetical protein
MNVFRRGDEYVFFLTYGSDVQWVKNVLAAGSCSIETRGRMVELVEPELITDPELRPAPVHVRFVERRLAGVTQYLRMRTAKGRRVSADGMPFRGRRGEVIRLPASSGSPTNSLASMRAHALN